MYIDDQHKFLNEHNIMLCEDSIARIEGIPRRREQSKSWVVSKKEKRVGCEYQFFVK